MWPLVLLVDQPLEFVRTFHTENFPRIVSRVRRYESHKIALCERMVASHTKSLPYRVAYKDTTIIAQLQTEELFL